MKNEMHTQTTDPGMDSGIEVDSDVRCIMFNGSTVDGVVVGRTVFHVTVNVGGADLDFRYEDVSLIDDGMDDFELTAKLHARRFVEQRAYLNRISEDERFLDADGWIDPALMELH